MVREDALLVGGPANGVRVMVTDRPGMLLVTYPCTVETSGAEVKVDALHVYRLDRGAGDGSLRYGYDPASP